MSLTVNSSSSHTSIGKMTEPYTFSVGLENQRCRVDAISIEIFPKNFPDNVLGSSTSYYSKEKGGTLTLDGAVLKSGMRFALFAIENASGKKMVFHGKWSGKVRYLLQKKVSFCFPETSQVRDQNKKPFTIPI